MLFRIHARIISRSQHQHRPANTSKCRATRRSITPTHGQYGAHLRPPSNDTQQVNTTISVSATRLSDNVVTATGSSTITVLPAKSASATPSTTPAPTTTTKPASTYTASGNTSNLYGSADLAVQILSAQPVNGRYQVEFQISNVGTNVTPSGWEFTAQLPTSPTYTYQSQAQQKLYPGDRIVYTLGFDMCNMGNAYTYNIPIQSSSYSTSYPYSNCSVSQNYTYNGYANYPTDPTYNCNTATAYNSNTELLREPAKLLREYSFLLRQPIQRHG